MRKTITLCLFFILHCLCFAQAFLPTNAVFALSAQFESENRVTLTWNIADGYHLFQNQFNITPINPERVSLSPIVYPKTNHAYKTSVGTYLVYEKTLSLPLIINTQEPCYEIAITYQGCANHGVCLAPQTRYLYVNNQKQEAVLFSQADENFTLPHPKTHYDALLSNNILLAWLIFFGIGVLLAFTPCVLPMIPVLSSIIVGANSKSHTRGFELSLVYVLAMALTYALVGAVFSLLGKNLQTLLQNPITLIAGALIFLVLAFSLFGCYELQLPQWLRAKASHWSNEQKHGTFLGTATMGVLSTLILSPCVTPPLIGAIMYIARTGNLLYGSLALFFMGLGMGLPLILIGTLGAKFLPKAGVWMNLIKFFFGFILIGVSLWIIMRILPASIMMILWGIYAISAGTFFYIYDNATHRYSNLLIKIFSILVALYGIFIVIGAALGNQNPLVPLRSNYQASLANNKLQIFEAHNVNELQTLLGEAKDQQTAVMLDYFADWCISCKEIDHTISSSPRIMAALQKMWVIKVDITNDGPDVEALKKANDVFAPPVLLFYDTQGHKIDKVSIQGPVSEAALLKTLYSIH